MITFKHIMFIGLLILLQGCSSKFAYNNADWLSNWYLDDYLDLNADQNRILKEELISILQWHRNTQLSKYKQQLLMLSKDIDTRPMSEQQWQTHFEQFTAHWHRARQEISYRSAKLAPLLTDTQVDYLFRKLHEKNQTRLNEFKGLEINEYRANRLDTLKDTIEDYLGLITPQQIAYAKTFTSNAIETEQEWFDSKLALQTAMKEQFQSDDETLTITLYELMINPDQFKNARLLDAYKVNRGLLIAMLHKLSGSLSPEQAHNFKEKLSQWIELIESLEKKT